MAVKPKLGEYTSDKNLGTGALQKSFDYLKTSDPVAYYYNKLKYEGNQFLRDDMWNEALRRGETATLVNLLSERQKIEKGKEYSKEYKDMTTEALDKSGVDALSKWEAYGNTADYDGYMLALSVPTLDDTVKKPRTTTDGSYKFGDFTDREWAIQILDQQFQQYDNAIIEENKKSQNFFQQLGNVIVSTVGNVTVGISNFATDVFNVGEGLLNMMINWSGDKSAGAKFLWAFQNDPENPLAKAMYDFHRENAIFGQSVIDARTGEVTTFGKYWNGITESIGYMVPSILLTQGAGALLKGVSGGAKIAGAIGQATFYTGIFSGNIKDTVTAANKAGISYKDLNAGNVVANAAIKAGAQLVVEKLLAKFMGASGLDRLIGTASNVTKAATKAATQATATGVKAIGIVASRAFKDMAKEGLEEALQDLSDGIIDTVFGQGGSQLNELYLSRGQETITLQNIADAFVMGALTSAMVGSFKGTFTPRAVMTDAEGKTYKTGLFQSLNFRNALATMNEWNNTLNNDKASLKARQEAALNISKSISLLGSFNNNIGIDRAIRANNILNQMINNQATEARINEWLKDGYAKNLYTNFVQSYDKLVKEHKAGKNVAEKTKLFDKIKKVLSNNKIIEKLQKHKVTEAKNFITQDSTIEETNLSTDSLTKLKQIAKGLGADVIIATDGSIVTEAEGILFVDNKLVKSSDVESIIQGTTYDLVETIVIDTLSNEQKEFLTEQYGKIVSGEVNLETTIQALLFDKEFYTKLLLMSSDTKSNNDAISLLTTIYTIVKNKIVEQNTKGTISKTAANTLLEKILNTLRTGLISYATKYVNYDINQLADDIFPKELKEAVNNHRNVLFTKFVNTNVENAKTNKPITPRDLETYDKIIDTYYEYIDDETLTTLKQNVRSTQLKDRISAWMVLSAFSELINRNKFDNQKAIFLPPISESDTIIINEYTVELERLFGTSLDNIINGNIDPNNLTEELKEFITSSIDYTLENRSNRIELVRELLFDLSNGQFTIDVNFNFLKVLNRKTFLKPEYKTKISMTKLKEKVISGEIKTLSDITALKLPKDLASVKIIYDTETDTNKRGSYNYETKTIILYRTASMGTILHEATHATQHYIKDNSEDNSFIFTGGNPDDLWASLKTKHQVDLKTYLAENFPIMYKLLRSAYQDKTSDYTFKQMLYFMLEGEVQARTSLGMILPVVGFTYSKDKSELISPLNDNKRWPLIINSDEKLKKEIGKIRGSKPLEADIFIKGKTIDEKDTKTNIDTAKAFDKVFGKTRYITNKRANQSNLKYFVKKGVPIQMHPGVADFIESTTTEFDKLPTILKDKIKAGTLNKYDILDYVATANNIDDFTFKAIAKNIFNNTEAEKITYKDMKKLFNELEELATISYIAEHLDKQLTPTELLNEKKAIWKKLDESNEEFNKQYKTATERAISFRLDDKRIDEVHADPSQLQIAFFRIYDGSLKSIRDLNNYGKLISVMQDPEALDLARIEGDTEVEGEGVTEDISTARTNWNWTESQKFADTAYKYDEAQDILDDITREDKVAAIKDYLINTTSAKLAAQTFTREQQLQIARGLQERLDKIENASDAEIDKRYLVIIANEGTRVPSANKPVETVSKVPYEQQAPSKKNIKDQLRNLGRTITKRIASLKSRYNSLSDEVKEYIDSKTYTLNDKYKSLSIEELNTILPKFQEASKSLKSRITKSEIESRIQAEVEKRIAKLTKNMKGPKEDKTTKKTIREKIEVKHTTKIVNQEFTVSSTVELTKNDNPDIMTGDKLVHSLLSTNWEKYSDSEVQGVDTKDAKSVASIKDFFVQNTDILLSADLNTIEEVCRWFLATTLNNATDEDFRQFNIIKQYFLEYVLTYVKAGSIYENLNANLKQQIDNWVEKNASQGGTALAIHNNMLNIKDPLRNMRSADMILDGVPIEGENKDKLFKAIESTDINEINKVIREIRQYVEERKTNKRSFARKVVTVRSMSMLSGPLTWLRNRVSNIVLKRLNKLSSALGNKMFKNKTQQGQLKLTAQITPEIQKYITDNFVNNELFDTIIANISKYNPSDIQSMKQTDLGVATKEAILAQLVIKSMYNEYYNNNMFKSKFMNQIYQGLMKVMSDDTYVREAAIRYFGKILAENNRVLDKGVTDEIMNDFAKALGLALGDYMHSENFFNKWENILLERGEAGWFLYKTVLPFASASWNWFKAMIKMSPLGLGRSIIKIWRLENNVKKAQQLWQEGKSQISPELTEYIIRRDLGQGVIGTVAFILGIALAALGFIQLDDDDYGNPKLTIGNIKVDISSIFGSSSVLAGAAFVTGIKDEGSFNEALNRTLDVMLDNFPIMQILELDMYSNGSWDVITSTLESTALSFIPNFLSYLAGATYSGNVKKDTFWRRAAAKIPFLGNFLPKKVDPYTGSKGSYIDALNRIIPYFSLKVASDNEKKTTELGLNKTMLRGQYSINGEEFNVKGKDLDTINKLYGQWNANDLTKFYDNKMKVEVKVGNTYKLMSYNQMDDKQRKSAVQTIMSNNAELAKIYAWTVNGNKYYASETIYVKLKKYGISKNVYRGSQGFVKKK